ncbi:Hypothetical protein, putative [Bodo saltans]|uniref:Uncharacterized protein n=1 Tax=Bodo saltans TaxID=75058 RepID=A0A0S4IYZ6_BODSA|nr:Hypothetical protein, putative [Bodo saltans]|eukprot:CUG01488.1 Hypothetical protein, putative [Bodo saltans]
MRPVVAAKKPQVSSRLKRDASHNKSLTSSYDELVLQWAMSAPSITAAERSDIIETALDNRRAAMPLLHTSQHDPSTDEVLDEMEACIASLRAQDSSDIVAATELRRLTTDARSILGKDVKLELCLRQQSESIFQLSAVWEELQLQALHRGDLEVLEEVSWRPAPSQTGSVCSYVAYGMHGIVFLRIHDSLTFDASGHVQLIVRTMLYHPDDAARGRNARWAPHFGTLSKLVPLA